LQDSSARAVTDWNDWSEQDRLNLTNLAAR